MKSSLRTLFYGLLLGLILGCASVIHLLEHDAHFSAYILSHLQSTFHQQFNGIFTGNLDEVRLLFPKLVFKNVNVRSPDGTWQWQADKLEIRFSWITLLHKKKIELDIDVNDLHMQSQLEHNQPAIVAHLQSFIFGDTGVPIGLNELHVSDGTFTLRDDNNNEFRLPINCHAAMYGPLFRLNVTGSDGIGLYNGAPFFDSCIIDCKLRTNTIKSEPANININGSLQLCNYPQDNAMCSIRIQWGTDAGQCIITNKDNSFVCAIYDVLTIGGATSARYQLLAPIIYIQKIIQPLLDFKLDGNALIQGACTLGKQFHTTGGLSLSSMHWHPYLPTYIDLTYENDKDQWHGSAQLSNQDVGSMKGHWFYSDTTGSGQLSCSNDQPCAFDQWVSAPHNLLLQATLENKMIDAMYYMNVRHKKTDQVIELDGACLASPDSIKAHGTYNKGRFAIEQSKDVGSIILFDKSNEELIRLETKPDGDRYKMRGFIQYRLVYNAIKELLGYTMPGQGRFQVRGIYEDGVLKTKLELKNANIRLLNTYNLIKEICAFLLINFKTQTVTAENVSVMLDKGYIECKKALVHAKLDGSVSFIHAPCILHNLFINMKKDMFAVVSGNILFTYKPPEAQLEGALFIDRAQLKQNVFSQAVQKDLLSSLQLPKKPDQHINLNLAIESKNPIQVRTSFIQTGVHAKLHAQGTIAQPQITGTLELQDGQLSFPYRPLTITSGKLYFLPHQLDDPIIELVAKGKIRNYHITMRCTGSLQQQHITFESTPPLTEEQIVTLLLAGSEEGSLNLIVPTVVMQRLQDLMFGNDTTPTKIERYIKNIFGPFRFIRFVPKFADQTARGGIRGAIEIDVGDKLRALIQKNFSLTEDTKIEIEYYASDDVTIRGLKDERSDIGGEIEIRWKF